MEKSEKMQALQSPRGTQDFLPEEMRKFRVIEKTALETAALYGFKEMSTPIFEFSPVFHRTLGESSDVVSKETYTFTDRGGESLTLRPEGTAGLARAFISQGMQQLLPLRLCYSGPMFRYERPQKGRFRQFHQFGVEALGFDSARIDAEVISLGFLILQNLHLQGEFSLELNTLGDVASRASHREKLVQYLNHYIQDLSQDSQTRLQKNPLRILDSKDPQDQKILEGAPLLQNELNSASQEYFSQLQQSLSDLHIPFKINPRLVRGLDYYNHTVFEITTQHLGAQSALVAGGRYDGLIELMGGPPTVGVGWAFGFERLMMLLPEKGTQEERQLTALIPLTEDLERTAHAFAYHLRQQGQACQVILGGNIAKRFKKADKAGAQLAYLLGPEEFAQKQFVKKNLITGEQNSEPLPASLLSEPTV